MLFRKYRVWLCFAVALGVAQGFVQSSVAASSTSYIDDLVDRANTILKSSDADRDPSLAIALLREAIRSNDVRAMLILAGVMAKGDKDVPADATQAETLLKQAIASGAVAVGADALGDFYRSETPAEGTCKGREGISAGG